MKILLIEDEKQLTDALANIFKKEKYSVDIVADGAEGLEFALTGIYDIILLDVMLPTMDGFSVLKALRHKHIKTPVLMLTALNTVNDKITGLDLGADDYLPKPFSVPELLARIRALSRRKNDTLIQDNVLTFGDLSLDLKGYRLYTAKNSVKVSVKEFEIIRFLMEKPSFIATRDDMIAKIWGFDSELESNNIEVYISFLRKKLSYIGSDVNIVTVRGVGYQLEDACSKS
ncbi:MAG TPA: response regulator transcription factor [Candidatus Faecicola pullistercoris]|nr:response regulator transcription factor [Candidatus Faecicola pullistercoris]